MFKVGDRVRCVDARPLYAIPTDLVTDEMYTVKEVGDHIGMTGLIRVDVEGQWLSASRFDKVEDEPITLRPGDYVQYIDIKSQAVMDEIVNCFVYAGADDDWMEGHRICIAGESSDRRVGWDIRGKINAWSQGYRESDGQPWSKRRLTVQQVLTATNAQKKEKPMEQPKGVDWSKPIQTRDGSGARLLCSDRKGGQLTHVVAANSGLDPEVELVYPVTVQGHYLIEGTSHKRDIINVPEKPEPVWVEVKFRDVPHGCVFQRKAVHPKNRTKLIVKYYDPTVDLLDDPEILTRHYFYGRDIGELHTMNLEDMVLIKKEGSTNAS